MSRATVELDFFGQEMMIKQKQQQEQQLADSNISQFQKFLHRQRSNRSGARAAVPGRFHTTISKINPDILKSVLSSVSLNNNSNDNNNKTYRPSVHNLPEYSPAFRACSENGRETAPMTIFYNGTVAVFDVSPDKVESIMKLAAKGSSRLTESEEMNDQKQVAVSSSNQQQLLDSVDGDLPIARRKSLQRFLEKRKERLTSPSPYASSPT